ncbi:putative WHI2-like protein P4H10.16c [Sclerotinia borealis F-4128]|uniref:Putative WHI2-like protein P4H10.16c n=1 Tax=Sclerotinia borealis (strain F-4128) TaxID=1432307 RepID=W9CWK3_SCLBF|nr:putative WHI2-like protein P4H10.16c [Sclerotinia borealis F-4128]
MPRAITLSNTQGANDGPSVGLDNITTEEHELKLEEELDRTQSPPPRYPISEPSHSTPSSPRPPPFSSLYTSAAEAVEAYKVAVTEAGASLSISTAAPEYATVASNRDPQAHEASTSSRDVEAETKAALPQDTKGESSKKDDENEPPPAYSEGSSPLDGFTYLMAAAGGAASIITQVQQGAAPINTLGDVGADENITMDLRGTRFTLSRDELLTLPEFVLLSLFPNGLLPDGHLSTYHEGDAFQVDVRDAPLFIRNILSNLDMHIADTFSQYDPASLQYMLEFFRNVAQTIPSGSNSPSTGPEADTIPIEPMAGSAREMLQDRAGIIVLREDLDFYAIPPRPDIDQPEMIEVKRAAGKALLKQDGIFSGLRRSEETGTTEQHLIEMLTAGGFNHDDHWGHRAGEPNKAVICSLALARLRTDIRGNEMGSNAVGMAQKLLLFWRKPARRCWWEGVELENVEGVDGKLKVWIRRVWTLEMSVIGLR